MKTIVNERFRERYGEETLDNGLHVMLWQKPGMQRSQCLLAVPYGSLDYRQMDDEGTIVTYPSGIAHFLEHKLFEMDGEDVMNRFSAWGAEVNAYTSYQQTVYYVSTTKPDFKQELTLLLDFVQDISVSEASVEKEKGIIVQELKMYWQQPDTRLMIETFRSLYAHHPLRKDIGGDEEDVLATTVDQLRACHRANYHPSRMVLAIVSDRDPQELLALVKDNQKKKRFDPPQRWMRVPVDEPAQVNRKHATIEMDVVSEKVSVAYKLPVFKLSKADRMRQEWSIRLFLEAHFSSLNPDYQHWLDEGLINDYFGYEIDLGEDYAFLMLYGEQEEERFVSFVRKQCQIMKQAMVDETSMECLRRRYLGTYIRMFDQPDAITSQCMFSRFHDMSPFALIEIIEGITPEKAQAAFASLDLSQECVTVLKKGASE